MDLKASLTLAGQLRRKMKINKIYHVLSLLKPGNAPGFCCESSIATPQLLDPAFNVYKTVILTIYLDNDTFPILPRKYL